MEGRYGQGADARDRIGLVSSFALGYGLFGMGKVASLLYASRARVATAVARAALYTEVTTGVAFSASQLSSACREKLAAVSGGNACTLTDKIGGTNLKYRDVEADSCVMAVASGLVTGGLGVHGLTQVFKGSVAEKLLKAIGERSERTARYISNFGSYDAVEPIAVRQAGDGKIVTVARRPGIDDWENLEAPSIPDPVFDPRFAVDNLGAAGSKMGFKAVDANRIEIPDGPYLRSKIEKFNSTQTNPARKLGLSYYETGDQILDGKEYVVRFIDRAEIPVARAGQPGSQLRDSGHLQLHDVTAHGIAFTMPKPIVDSARDAYRLWYGFESALQKQSPALYNEIKKAGVLERVEDRIVKDIDFSTGLWTHIVTNSQRGNFKSAGLFIDRFGGILSGRSPEDYFMRLVGENSWGKSSDQLKKAAEEFVSKAGPGIKQSPKPAGLSNEDLARWYFEQHQKTVEAISKTDF